MAELVPTEDIERIVGASRHPVYHYARAVSSEQTVYILHSQRCKDSGIDLLKCQFTVALSHGIDIEIWRFLEDVPVWVTVVGDQLVPVPF